jgi:bifunctional UDP-N-acetylglucosamine pyrophosphorylase/glucosamine-1-phosphate N-acetyltransferase
MISNRQDQTRQVLEMIEQGLNVIDPNRVDIRGELQFGNNVHIDINVIFIGKVVLGDNVKIGPNCIINNTTIQGDTLIKEYSSIEGSVIEKSCIIGPYARIRPSSKIGAGSQIGNFVEIKNTNMRNNCKINHHSFIGDATLGINVIIGAGCITVNFKDGKAFTTVIEDSALVGAGTQLIAPIKVGANAIIGAGSTITKNVNANSIVLARAEQVTLKE